MFSPRTVADVEQAFVTARRVGPKKWTVKDFKDAAVAHSQTDDLGRAVVMRWFRSKMAG